MKIDVHQHGRPNLAVRTLNFSSFALTLKFTTPQNSEQPRSLRRRYFSSKCVNGEIDKGADFRRPMLARGIQGIERKQLARPIGKQLDQPTAVDDVL
jgi:hypothetical protein